MAKRTHGNQTHGMSSSPEYRAWRTMISRCKNPNASAYKNYGGRGISVCQRWVESFENFLSDMGRRPSGLSIDRINNDGNYEPGNCRWATRTEQARNSRMAKPLTFRGETMCFSAWAERTGIHWLTLYKRIKRGWSVEKALVTPRDNPVRYATMTTCRRIEFRGETLTLSQWARRLGITKQSLASRIKHKGVEDALGR